MERSIGLSFSAGCDGRGGIEGCGDLSLVPPTEQICIVYYDQAHYGPMSGGKVEAG